MKSTFFATPKMYPLAVETFGEADVQLTQPIPVDGMVWDGGDRYRFGGAAQSWRAEAVVMTTDLRRALIRRMRP